MNTARCINCDAGINRKTEGWPWADIEGNTFCPDADGAHVPVTGQSTTIGVPATADTVKGANQLDRGDEIINVGKVVAKSEVGVFVVLRIETGVWSLATGTREADQYDLVLHAADEVTVKAAA